MAFNEYENMHSTIRTVDQLPEGIEWPRYEDGELVQIGDDVIGPDYGEQLKVLSVELHVNGFTIHSVCGFSRWYESEDRFERPPVLAADGEPLEAGQTVWSVNDGKEFEVVNVNGELPLLEYGETAYTATEPEHLTHQRPVLDADGTPIHEGDTVYNKVTGEPGAVIVVDNDGQQFATVKSHDRGNWCDPLCFTHTKPELSDTWQRIEEDATLSPEVYCHRNGIDISQKDGTEIFLADTVEPMARDLVRRCREVAERERGE